MNKCSYLRIRLTDRCNLRCPWCHHEGGGQDGGTVELSPEKIEKATRLLAGCGFTKIKLTGGEPTMRLDLDQIIRMLAPIPRIDLSMMTNGTLLTDERLERYYHAGLRRINVSINTLDSRRFRRWHGQNTYYLQTALGSIGRLLEMGYDHPKINFLYQGLESDADLDSLIRFAQKHSVKITILNIIPTSAPRPSPHVNLTVADIIDKVVSLGIQKVHIDDAPDSFASLSFVLDGGVVIEVLHHQTGQSHVYRSCSECEVRAYCREGIFAQRLTPDGFLQPCLVRNDNLLDLRPYLCGEMNRADADSLVRSFLSKL